MGDQLPGVPLLGACILSVRRGVAHCPSRCCGQLVLARAGVVQAAVGTCAMSPTVRDTSKLSSVSLESQVFLLACS